MKRKFLWRRMGALLLCTALGICAGAGEGRAETDEKMTLQSYVESRGAYYGEYGDCMYSYTNQNREIKIIGFQHNKKKIQIPDKINGKKVTEICLLSPDIMHDDYYGITDYIVPDAESIYISKYIKRICMRSNRDLTFQKNEIAVWDVLRWIKKYEVSPENKYFSSKDGVLFTKDKKKLLAFPRKKKTKKYKIPKGVTHIGYNAFEKSIVKNIEMANTVKVIEGGAFSECSAKRISLSKNLRKLGLFSFYYSAVREITIPGTVKEISNLCFADSELRKVVVKSGVKKIDKAEFSSCDKLKSVYIPASVKKMSADSFGKRKQKKVKLTIYVDKKNRAYKKEKRWKKYGIKVKVLSSRKSKKIF